VDRAHRQELKHDKFVEQVGHTVEYAAGHKKQITLWTIIAIVVILGIVAGYYYMSYQAAARQEALAAAIHLQEAQVGQQQNPFLKSFATQEEKDKAVTQAWNDLANKYSGSAEALVAHHYMAVNAADKGNLAEAEKHFKQVADSGKDNYAALAKLSLADIYASTNRVSEAEKLLQSIIDHPTPTVSKEQATIALARLIAPTRPADARKLLEPLRTASGAASRAALNALGQAAAK
jgi:predicted negative regulator of RcsB-dependent stress response